MSSPGYGLSAGAAFKIEQKSAGEQFEWPWRHRPGWRGRSAYGWLDVA